MKIDNTIVDDVLYYEKSSLLENGYFKTVDKKSSSRLIGIV